MHFFLWCYVREEIKGNTVLQRIGEIELHSYLIFPLYELNEQQKKSTLTEEVINRRV